MGLIEWVAVMICGGLWWVLRWIAVGCGGFDCVGCGGFD